jgi:transcriptional regulator with XRE-family HTH domain
VPPSPASRRRFSDAQALAHTLRECRLARGLTQERLAEEAGITKNYVSDLEGARRNPTVRVIGQVLDALGMTWATFGAAFDRRRTE